MECARRGAGCAYQLQLFHSKPSPNITQHFDLALLGCWWGEPYCISNARVWGRDERGSFHILLG